MTSRPANDKELDRRIGTALRELRRSQGWSQATLAKKLDVSTQAVSQWETGKTLPSTGRIAILTKILSQGSAREITTPAIDYLREAHVRLFHDPDVDEIKESLVVAPAEIGNIPQLLTNDSKGWQTLKPYDTGLAPLSLCVAVEDDRMDPVLISRRSVVFVSPTLRIRPGLLGFGFSTDNSTWVLGYTSILGYDNDKRPMVALRPANEKIYPSTRVDIEEHAFYEASEYRTYTSPANPAELALRRSEGARAAQGASSGT
jgi:transcriptional regulator with XRE-family HTH domain